jgi:hypothetical protein
MTINEWISMGSSVGAMSAALVALFTLFELARQRRSAYKPDLCVIKKHFNIAKGFIGNTSSLPFAIDWMAQGTEQQGSFAQATIRIVNVGFGVAKDVKVKWTFDIKSFIDEVNQLAQKKFQTYFLVEQNQFLSVMSKGNNIYSANTKMDSLQFEYLLPVGNQPSGQDILLPPAYVLLVSSYLCLSVKTERTYLEIKVPNIVLELSYIDIGGKRYTSEHKLNINIIMIGQHADEESFPQFSIEFAEIA